MIALVTGGTGGIGYEVAAKLSAKGITALVTGRDPDRGKAAEQLPGVSFLPADHLTIAGNLDLAARVRSRTERLDILVNNVGGAAFAERTTTPEGHEATLALNYLGPIALTQALQPSFAADVRVVETVSSAFTMYKDDPFVEPDDYTAIKAYARAKQLNLLATLHLATVLSGDAHVNAVNPGMAWTPGVAAMTPDTVPQWRLIWPVVRAFQRRSSPEKAARTPAVLATGPSGNGLYYESNGKSKTLSLRLRNEVWHRRAWHDVTELTSTEPGPTA